jgi:hypothetical protein
MKKKNKTLVSTNVGCVDPSVFFFFVFIGMSSVHPMGTLLKKQTLSLRFTERVDHTI